MILHWCLQKVHFRPKMDELLALVMFLDGGGGGQALVCLPLLSLSSSILGDTDSGGGHPGGRPYGFSPLVVGNLSVHLHRLS